MNIKITFLYPFFMLFFAFQVFAQTDTVFIAQWNVENLFDAVDDPGKNDEDFLPDGKKEWTENKIDLKLEHLAKVIAWMNSGKGPDILAVEEVEHKYLLDTLLTRYLKNHNYKIAYKESPDKRGIDNGLIYNSAIFSLIDVKSIHVELPSKYPTRDILQIHLKAVANKEDLYCFVNHWPSRRGGEEKSRPNRIAAAQTLRTAIDSLQNLYGNAKIIILGDFNDEPNNTSIVEFLKAVPVVCNDTLSVGTFYNLAYDIFTKGLGTYLYRGDWNMLDQIIVSSSIINGESKFQFICNSFMLIKPQFMITQHGKYKGAATPTFGGRKYLKGFSDHIPVGAKFILK